MIKKILLTLTLILCSSLSISEGIEKDNLASYGHIHLAAPDPTQAADWYAKHFDGKPAGFGGATGAEVEIDRVYFGDISVIFFKREPGEGSIGSGVDHIGFSMPNVASKVQSLINDGAKNLGEITKLGDMELAFVTDPWGTKIEVVNNKSKRGLHHIHVYTPNPETTLAWYQKAFGGEIKKLTGDIVGINYDEKIWLFARKSIENLAPTKGRSLDHLGWNFTNLDESAARLKAAGVKFTTEPRDYRGIRIAFVEGPDGVRIELVQPQSK